MDFETSHCPPAALNLILSSPQCDNTLATRSIMVCHSNKNEEGMVSADTPITLQQIRISIPTSNSIVWGYKLTLNFKTWTKSRSYIQREYQAHKTISRSPLHKLTTVLMSNSSKK
jgi:hypothetical protein